MRWSAARIVWLVLVVVCVDARTARNASIQFFSNETVVPSYSQTTEPVPTRQNRSVPCKNSVEKHC